MKEFFNKKVTFKQIFADGGTISAEERQELEALTKELQKVTGNKFTDYKISDSGYVEIPAWSVYYATGDPKYGEHLWSIGAKFLSEKEAKDAAKFLNKLYTIEDFRKKQHRFIFKKASIGPLSSKGELTYLIKVHKK